MKTTRLKLCLIKLVKVCEISYFLRKNRFYNQSSVANSYCLSVYHHFLISFSLLVIRTKLISKLNIVRKIFKIIRKEKGSKKVLYILNFYRGPLLLLIVPTHNNFFFFFCHYIYNTL